MSEQVKEAAPEPVREVEVHDDEARLVKYVHADDHGKAKQRVLRSRPMKPEEIKAGRWKDPRGSIALHRSLAPAQYRQLCRNLAEKGFVPVDPVPTESVTVTAAK